MCIRDSFRTSPPSASFMIQLARATKKNSPASRFVRICLLYTSAADAYYQKNTQTEGSIPVEPVFAAGDKLSTQYRRYTGQDEAGNEVYRTYTAQLPIVGVVKSANNYTLLTTCLLYTSRCV